MCKISTLTFFYNLNNLGFKSHKWLNTRDLNNPLQHINAECKLQMHFDKVSQELIIIEVTHEQ